MARFLYDDETWTDASGREHRIADMEIRYCRNVVAFLERRAVALAQASALDVFHMPLPAEDTAAFDAVWSDLEREWDMQDHNPVGWLNEKPLLKALRYRFEGDAQHQPFGCRWCGDPERSHGSQWIASVGLHIWVQPTDEQIKLRMQTRRAARKGGDGR